MIFEEVWKKDIEPSLSFLSMKSRDIVKIACHLAYTNGEKAQMIECAKVDK